MIEKMISALQERATMLFGEGTIKLIRTGPMGGQFVVENGDKGDKTVTLGDTFERAYDKLLEMSGISIKTATIPQPDRKVRSKSG